MSQKDANEKLEPPVRELFSALTALCVMLDRGSGEVLEGVHALLSEHFARVTGV